MTTPDILLILWFLAIAVAAEFIQRTLPMGDERNEEAESLPGTQVLQLPKHDHEQELLQRLSGNLHETAIHAPKAPRDNGQRRTGDAWIPPQREHERYEGVTGWLPGQ